MVVIIFIVLIKTLAIVLNIYFVLGFSVMYMPAPRMITMHILMRT